MNAIFSKKSARLAATVIGYVFVADGLPTKVAVEDSALVLFCPASSHQRSEQHCHAVVGSGELLCLESNLEMIEMLRREIGRAQDGKIPYSTNAVTKMERELKAREEHAVNRPSNFTDIILFRCRAVGFRLTPSCIPHTA